MKHFRILLPLLILALILSACGGEKAPYEYTAGDVTLTVDPENRTITCGDDVYTYEITYSANNTVTEIHYPDGESYWWNTNRSGGLGGWSDGYDESRYLPGSVLVDALETNQPREKVGNYGLGFLLILLGLVNFFFPEALFYLRKGWMFKNAEPSDAYIAWTKISGVIFAVVGLIACII